MAKLFLKTAKILALLATVRTDDSFLTFLPTNQITFYEHSVIQQVMISTEFLPIEKSFYDKIELFLLNKTATATADDIGA